LGTWRSPVGQRRESEEPTFSDEPEGKLAMRGAYASQRLSFLIVGKACRGKPGSEPYSGNPTVRDRRGACGNVDVRRARRSSVPPPRPLLRVRGVVVSLHGHNLAPITGQTQIGTFRVHEVQPGQVLVDQGGAKQRTATARADPLPHPPDRGRLARAAEARDP